MPRVLIVDDSPTARDVLSEILGAEPDLEVVGFAANGREALAKVAELKPDVVTMDLSMPVMDGFEATREIMCETPTPIVIVSSTSRAAEVETAMEALQAGALNLLLKPVGPSSPEFASRAKEIVRSVRAMAGVFVIRRRRKLMEIQQPAAEDVTPPVRNTANVSAVLIAASTGGPPALGSILGSLPADYPVPILVVQHIAPGFIDGFVRWLDGSIGMNARIARDHEILKPSTVYFAPQDRHLGMTKVRIRLSDASPIGGFRPAGNYLMEKAAEAFGNEAVGVILTGMGDDGVDGLKRIHDAGGVTIAQDEQSSAVFGMPRAAIEAGVVDEVLSLASIGKRLRDLIPGER